MSEISLILVLQNKNNLRGGKERIFDDMNNGFGWNRLPKSFMAQNTVFLLMTALIRNFYKAIMQRLKTQNLDCVPPAESRPLFSSSSLFLRNGLRHHVGMY